MIDRVAATSHLAVAELCSESKRRSIVRARAALAFLAIREAGLPASAVALALGVTPRALAYTLLRGETVVRELRLHHST